MVWLVPPDQSTKVLFLNVSGVTTGNVGGKSLPPVSGSPVRFPTVKALTPGLPGAPANRLSRDKYPTESSPAWQAAAENSRAAKVAASVQWIRTHILLTIQRRRGTRQSPGPGWPYRIVEHRAIPHNVGQHKHANPASRNIGARTLVLHNSKAKCSARSVPHVRIQNR